MKGILYGVGTGPGDPELLTLKALKIIRESDIIVIPADDPKDCASYQTVERAFPQIREKRLICLPFPMVRDREKRRIQQEKNAEIIAKILSKGKQAAFLTIGDPSIYSTYGYIHNILRRRGFDARIVSGIPSFCAAAASLGEILCEDRETLEILPSFPLSWRAGYLRHSLGNRHKSADETFRRLYRRDRSAAPVQTDRIHGGKLRER